VVAVWIALIIAAFICGLLIRGKFMAEKQYPLTITVLVAGDFEVTLTPDELTLTKGESGMITLANTASGGFDVPIHYDLSGLPDGAYSFAKNPVDPNESTTLTINSIALASNTVYVCTLTASDQSL